MPCQSVKAATWKSCKQIHFIGLGREVLQSMVPFVWLLVVDEFVELMVYIDPPSVEEGSTLSVR